MEVNKPKKRIETEGVGGLHVLGADDDLSMRILEEKIFGMLGINFQSVPNAQEGLRELESNPTKYQLVVSDRDMPGMNGEDFLVAVRRMYPEIQTTLISGRKYEGVEVEQLRKKGIDRYIQKPFSLSQIEGLIENTKNELEKRSQQL